MADRRTPEDVPIGHLATRRLHTVDRSTPLAAARSRMLDVRTSALVVVHEGRPVGMLSQHDVLRALDPEAGLRGLVGDAMTATLVAVDADAPVSRVAHQMVSSRVHRVLVRFGDDDLGIASLSDIARAWVPSTPDAMAPLELHIVGAPDDAPTPRSVFLASLQRLERALREDGFARTFYERLLASSADIRARFAGTDPAGHPAKLMAAFWLAADAVRGEPEARAALADQARLHDRHHRNVPPELYDRWLEVLVDTVRDTDPDFTLPVEAAWRTVMGHVAHIMKRRY